MSIIQGFENFIQPYNIGTHGAGNWKYYGNALLWVAKQDHYQSGDRDYYASIAVAFADISNNSEYDHPVYNLLASQVQEVAQYALQQPGWNAYDAYVYLYNWLMNLVQTGVMQEWETYKFCYGAIDATAVSERRIAGYYVENPAGTILGPGYTRPMSINATVIRLRYGYSPYLWPDLSIYKDQSDDYVYYVDTSRPQAWDLITNNYLVFDRTTTAISDFLTGNQDPGPEPPSEPQDYDNTPIRGSDEYNNLIENFLTNFTVLAEIDGANLNVIAQALNNNITLDDSIPEMLAKIARSIIQKNIAEGILSIKIIPIPKGDSLPYKTGIAENLFKPLGLSYVQGKKLKNTLKKYTIGSMSIHKIYDDYRDFLCEYSIYLPFSGIHRLDADVIVGNTLQIYADIDFLTGTILYHLIVNDGYTARDIYTFTGDCAIELPITGNDYSQKYQSIMSGIFSGVGMAAGAMLGGPMGAGAGAALTNVAMSGLKTLGNAASVKGSYMQSGKLVPNSAALSVLYPYLIISKPQDVSPNYASVKGKPCHKMLSLSSLSGFSIVSNINLDSIAYATDEDKEALRSLLANGVYF